MADRFLRSYHPGPPDACWPWTGSRDRDGYGVITDERRRQLRAHRVAYERVHGPLTPGQYVLHRCDNPQCCNPAHLFVGSIAENNTDRRRKNRYPLGEAHHKAKLTEQDVREIRRRYAAGRTSQQAIADDYGMNQTVISDIVRRVKWTHVKD